MYYTAPEPPALRIVEHDNNICPCYSQQGAAKHTAADPTRHSFVMYSARSSSDCLATLVIYAVTEPLTGSIRFAVAMSTLMVLTAYGKSSFPRVLSQSVGSMTTPTGLWYRICKDATISYIEQPSQRLHKARQCC
jgi:hypothetical protein